MAQEFDIVFNLPATYQRAVGHFTHQWSTLEHFLDRIIHVLVGLDHKRGRLITGRTMTREKTEILKALVQKEIPKGPLKDEAQKLVKFLEKANPDRNKFIHGIWVRLSGKKKQLFLLSISGNAENRILPRATPFTSKEITKLGDIIRAAGKLAFEVYYRLQSQQPST